MECGVVDMTLKEQILGFDTREMWVSYTDEWSTDRKVGFLLRQDLAKPLSVDRHVWPSVMEMLFPFAEILPQLKNESNLWLELEQMQDYIAHIWETNVKPHWRIAVTVLIEEQEVETEASNSFVVPNIIDPNWKFLGYDVAQTNLWSGLSNERYEPDEIQSLQARWVTSLNDYHLFKDSEAAIEFAEWADRRDIGHAPYDVYGIYLIQHLPEH